MLFFYSRMDKITNKVLKELHYNQYNSFVNLSISFSKKTENNHIHIDIFIIFQGKIFYRKIFFDFVLLNFLVS